MNVGVAAHITAASKGGPRYDESLTVDERKAPDNGIWLCQRCGKMIDSDDPRYTVDLLQRWRAWAEEAAQLEVEGLRLPAPMAASADRARIAFFRQAFDRPAFHDPFAAEGSVEDLDRALEDTVTALNTGTIRSRDGVVLQTGQGKSFVENANWRETLDAIVALVRSLRQRLKLARQAHTLEYGPAHGGRRWYALHDRELAEWVDGTRAQVLHLFNDVCRATGVPEMPVNGPFGRRSW